MNPINVVKAHPKKTGACAFLISILAFIGGGRPVCEMLPEDAKQTCYAITYASDAAAKLGEQVTGEE